MRPRVPLDQRVIDKEAHPDRQRNHAKCSRDHRIRLHASDKDEGRDIAERPATNRIPDRRERAASESSGCIGTSTPRAIAANRSSLRSLRTRKNVYMAAIGIPKAHHHRRQSHNVAVHNASLMLAPVRSRRRVIHSYAYALEKFPSSVPDILRSAPPAYKSLQNSRTSAATQVYISGS